MERRIFGLETEYGIQVDGIKELDVVVESIELIRCYSDQKFVARWNYRYENPRRDARGFEVDELLNDKDETLHIQRDSGHQLSLKELKSDLIITNGARLYNDHTHPEYSTPEVFSLKDLITYDRAGERILFQCAQRRTRERMDNGTVRLYKNNTDFEGHSYGCHENYLIRRDIPFQVVIDSLVPFLVTRQIFAGSGKVGVEMDRCAEPAVFQLSQRSDFFECIASIDTMTRRPLVNTRDEPHADASVFRRLHLINGDANMSEYATSLKVGTMLLVLRLMEANNLPEWELADPVGAVKAISRDPKRSWEVELRDHHHTTAIEIQRAYLGRAKNMSLGKDPETDWVLGEWEATLTALEQDPKKLVGKCDWVTKQWLLEDFAESEGLDWDNLDHLAWLQSQDLEYHNINPSEGLFMMLEADGICARVSEEEEVVSSLVEPPAGTRAFFRGRCLQKFGSYVRSLNWDRIEFVIDGQVKTVDLKGCVDQETAATFNQALEKAENVAELMQQLMETDYGGN